jgi:hypothetical protein
MKRLQALLYITLFILSLYILVNDVLQSKQQANQVVNDMSHVNDNHEQSLETKINQENKKEINGSYEYIFLTEATQLFDLPDSQDDKLLKLDKLFNDFINDSNISREAKNNILMNLANERTGNQRLYILDHLDLTFPIEQIDQLLMLFENSDNLDVKKRILSIMRSILIFDTNTLGNQAPSQDVIKNAEARIHTLSQEIMQDKGEIAKSITLNMLPLLPQQTQNSILSTLTKERRKELQITETDYGQLLFDIAITTPQADNFKKFRETFDEAILESNPDFIDRTLSTLRQISQDAVFQDFSKEILARIKELQLSPEAFVKASEIDIILQGVEEDKIPVLLRKKFLDSELLDKANYILGTNGQIIIDEGDAFKLDLAFRFLEQAKKENARSRYTLIAAALEEASIINNQEERKKITISACSLADPNSEEFPECIGR